MPDKATTSAAQPGGGAQKKKFHYAFIICLGGFLTQFIVLTCQRMPALSLELIRNTLGISYSEVGLITSWYTVFYAGASLFWGWLADRIGTKKTLTIAAAFASLGMILFGLFAQGGLVLAIALWCIAGFGCAGLFMATIPKIVARWFAPEKRGFGMALITPGANFASVIIGLVVPPLILSTSWQMSFVYAGLFCTAITVFIAICMKEDPAEKGLLPYGTIIESVAAPMATIAKSTKQAAAAAAGTAETAHAEAATAKTAKPASSAAAGATSAQATEKAAEDKAPAKSQGSLKRVLKMPITWHFGIMFIIWQIGYMITVAYYTATIQYVGFDLAQAGLAMTWGGIATIILIQLWGNLSDHIERKNVIAIASIACAALSIWYCMALQGQPPLWLCYVLVALITACTGVVTVIMSAAGDYYPAEVRATGTGTISTMSIVGRYLGPWLAGVIVDASVGNVGFAFIPVAVAMAVAGVIALTLPKLKGSATARS